MLMQVPTLGSDISPITWSTLASPASPSAASAAKGYKVKKPPAKKGKRKS